jgi:hypothetical protein
VAVTAPHPSPVKTLPASSKKVNRLIHTASVVDSQMYDNSFGVAVIRAAPRMKTTVLI